MRIVALVVLALVLPGFPSVARAQGVQLTNQEAIALAFEAIDAGKAGKLDLCIAKNKASLEKQENARTRLHLSGCESASGKLSDALRDAQQALQEGLRTKDVPLMQIARQRVLDLVARLPKVTFTRPAGIDRLEVKFDDHPVPVGSLTNKFAIDPGEHTVVASGRSNGLKLTYEETFIVAEGQLLTVDLTLRQPATADGVLNPNQLHCMAQAKTQEEVQQCIPQNIRALVVRAGADLAGYTDSTNVHVATPSLRAGMSSPTEGWNVSGSYLVDFVTAASPDIVSTASRRYRERRHVGALTGGYKPGQFGGQAYANLSSEPDYLSISGGGAFIFDLESKRVTPRIGLRHTDDTIGRSDTPFSIWKKKLRIEEVEAGATVVLSPTMVLVLGATFAAERGDQSKPYRFVPVFEPRIASVFPRGGSANVADFLRLPMRPAERLPDERDRYALGVRLAKRFDMTTLRLDERLYADSWGILASSTDARVMIDLNRTVRVWPHGRFHVQKGASFYQLAYYGVANDTGIDVPAYRTTDRELGALYTVTGGGGGRVALSQAEAKVQFALTLTADVMFTRFSESLYVNQRLGTYGVLSLDAEF